MMKSALTLVGCLVFTFTSIAASADEPAHNVSEPTEAVAVLTPTKGHEAQGIILLQQFDDHVRIVGKIKGLSPGKHGFHIHQYGDLRAADGKSAGGHYNPAGHKHGAPGDAAHHAGDLGNIVANEDGLAVIELETSAFKLHYVIGRALVVHSGADDFTSQPSGDAGARAALGVIGFANIEKPNEQGSGETKR